MAARPLAIILLLVVAVNVVTESTEKARAEVAKPSASEATDWKSSAPGIARGDASPWSAWKAGVSKAASSQGSASKAVACQKQKKQRPPAKKSHKDKKKKPARSKNPLIALLDKIPGFMKARTCTSRQKSRVMKKEVGIGLRCSVQVMTGVEQFIRCFGRHNLGLAATTSTRVFMCFIT